MKTEFKDTARAYHLRRDANTALTALTLASVGHDVATSGIAVIRDYIDALEKQQRIVNDAARQHTAGGSEYWDEPGVISGTLSAIRFIAGQAETNWEAFKRERIAFNQHKRRKPDWTQQRPTEEGMYWYYGDPYPSPDYSNENILIVVEVYDSGNGKLWFKWEAGGGSHWRERRPGWWCPLAPPLLPDETKGATDG